MKVIGFIFLLLLTNAIANGQKCVISATKENILYIGIANPIDIGTSKYSCKEISLATNNGIVETTDDPCSYLISPDKIGKAEISVVEKKGNRKVIGRAIFRVKAIPGPDVMLAGRTSGGEIGKSELKVQIALAAVLNGFDFDARFRIDSYTVIILRNEKVLFVRRCETPRFPSEVTQAFQTVQKNDKVVFAAVCCTAPDNKMRKLQPAEFTVVD